MNSSFFQTILVFLETKGTNIIVAIVSVVFGLSIIKNVMKIIKMAIIDSKLEKSMIKLFLNLIQIALYFLLILYALTKVGVGVSGVIAAFSAFSLAIGFAVQDVFSGVANGLVLVTSRPFKVGDFVEINGVWGTIKETNLMHTVIDTVENAHIYLPNKSVNNSKITNFSTNPTRRLTYDFVIDYDTDLVKAKSVLTDFINNYHYVLPGAFVSFLEMNDRGIKVRLCYWINNDDYGRVLATITEDVVAVCHANGIAFPYSQVAISQRMPLVLKQEISK